MLRRFSFNARERNHLFWNAQGDRFVEAAFPAGVDLDLEGRGVAVGDLNRDGGLDLLVRSVARRKLVYLRNELPSRGGFLQVDLVGTQSTRDAAGAVVRLHSGDLRQTRVKALGTGFQGQSEGTLHFGLGGRRRVDELEVRWPSGRVDHFTDIAANQRIRLTEGRETPEIVATPGTKRRPRDRRRATPASWRALSLDGRERVVVGEGNPPALIAFWASWCQSCRAEVPVLNTLARRLGDRVQVLGLTLEDDVAAARAFAEQTGARYEMIIAEPDELAPLLDRAFGGESLALPAAVLVDEEGRPVRAFQGAAGEAALMREVERFLETSKEGSGDGT